MLFLLIVTIRCGNDRCRLTGVCAKNRNNTAHCHTAIILALLILLWDRLYLLALPDNYQKGKVFQIAALPQNATFEAEIVILVTAYFYGTDCSMFHLLALQDNCQKGKVFQITALLQNAPFEAEIVKIFWGRTPSPPSW